MTPVRERERGTGFSDIFLSDQDKEHEESTDQIFIFNSLKIEILNEVR